MKIILTQHKINMYNLRFYFSSFLFILFFSSFAQNGQIIGRVFDKTSNEPLPFANVVVQGTQIYVATDIDGRFLISGLQPGFVVLDATYIGYHLAHSPEILISNAKQQYVDIPMDLAGVILDQVEVKANPFQRMEESPLSMQRLGLSEIETNPGSNRDISKVIQSLPGVGSGVSFRNDIIVRGGGPSESSFFLDGIQIPTINHFATQGSSGGAVGILNADFISSVDYYSGAFPANRGNALSGIFEFTQREGNKERLKFRGSLGASEVSLTADGPVGEKSSFIFSARRSYLQFLFDVIGLPFLPTFNDYQFKWKTRFNKKNELSIISIGSLDKFKLNTGIKNPTEEQQYILNYLPVNEQWSYAIGAVYRHFKENSFQTLVVSRNMLNNSTYKFPQNNESLSKSLDYISREMENKLRFENNIRYRDYKFVYMAGMEYSKYSTETMQQVFIENELKNINYSSAIDLFKFNASAQLSKSFVYERLNLSAGLRTDFNSYSKSMQNPLNQLSPRFSASFTLNEKWAVTANAGRYYQLPPYTALGFRNNAGELVNKNNELKYIGVNHLIAGIQFIPREEVFFSVEGFIKKYNHYLFSVVDSISLANKGADFGVLGNEEVVSNNKGEAYGFEILNRTKLPSRFNLITSYTFVHSNFEDKTGKMIPSSWDFNHIIVLTASKNFKHNWMVGLKWRFEGGLPYTPYDLVKSSIVEAWDVQGRAYLDYNQLNSLRLHTYNQLDLRVDKKYFYDRWSLMVYLDVQNLFNSVATFQDEYVPEQDANGDYITINNGYNYILKPIPSSSGTILPTVGIMVEF